MKLAVKEPETTALRAYLRRQRGHHRVTSALARTEVIRAMMAGRAAGIAAARAVLAAVDLIAITDSILEDAATLSPDVTVRSLDAIHLASARVFGADLHAIVTYDARMAAVADRLLLSVSAPA